VDAGAVPGEPPQGPLTSGVLKRDDGLFNGLALRLPVHQMILLPSVAVTTDLVAQGHDFFSYLRVTLKGQGTAEKGGLYLIFIEQVQ
jgi:hypothetical protein